MPGDSIDKKSIIPIYYQLAKLIEREIYSGSLKPGDALPAEHELAVKYEISRMTVRRAISELIAAGMVYALKGKGTFVASPPLQQGVFELGDVYEEVQKRGMKPGSKLLAVRIVKADAVLVEKLAVDLGTRCIYFRMVFAADNEPLAYETKYIVYTKQTPILETELKDPSLSNLVSLHSGSVPINSKRVLRAGVASEEEAGVLGIEALSPVFMVEQTIYDAEKKPIGWGKSIYRGDRYQLTSYNGWFVNDVKQ